MALAKPASPVLKWLGILYITVEKKSKGSEPPGVTVGMVNNRFPPALKEKKECVSKWKVEKRRNGMLWFLKPTLLHSPYRR